MEQGQARILSLLAHVAFADPFLPLLLSPGDVCLYCVSAKGQKVRNLDAAGFALCGLGKQLR